jgi:peptidoglycan-N-acetylglucosamine deacetylase
MQQRVDPSQSAATQSEVSPIKPAVFPPSSGPAAAPAPAQPVSPRWRPTPLLQASAALHCGALGLTIWHPRLWPWTVGAVVANHLQLVATGLVPRSALLGSNWTRLPTAAAAHRQVAVTFDDGPNPEITPRVLRLLEAQRARATFFCIGERVRRHPSLVRECVDAGHAIENHSYSHSACFALLSPRRLALEIARAQDAITSVSAQCPRFFRAPAGLRSPLLDPLLQRAGLQLASWTRRGFDTVRSDPDRVLGRLTRNLAAGDILLLHDGHAARTAQGVPVVLEVLPRLLGLLAARGLQPVTLREALACPR